MNEVKFEEQTVYISRNGKLEKVNPPESGFGKVNINWSDGKITHYEVSYTKK